MPGGDPAARAREAAELARAVTPDALELDAELWFQAGWAACEDERLIGCAGSPVWKAGYEQGRRDQAAGL